MGHLLPCIATRPSAVRPRLRFGSRLSNVRAGEGVGQARDVPVTGSGEAIRRRARLTLMPLLTGFFSSIVHPATGKVWWHRH